MHRKVRALVHGAVQGPDQHLAFFGKLVLCLPAFFPGFCTNLYEPVPNTYLLNYILSWQYYWAPGGHQ